MGNSISRESQSTSATSHLSELDPLLRQLHCFIATCWQCRHLSSTELNLCLTTTLEPLAMPPPKSTTPTMGILPTYLSANGHTYQLLPQSTAWQSYIKTRKRKEGKHVGIIRFRSISSHFINGSLDTIKLRLSTSRETSARSHQELDKGREAFEVRLSHLYCHI